MQKSRIARGQPRRSPPEQAGRGNRHPKAGLGRQALGVRLSASQLADLKKLARASGTTVLEQIDRAVDAYLLGISRHEIALLHALVAELENSTTRANKALDEVLQKSKKGGNSPVRKRRRGSTTRAAPSYPPDDGPLSEEHLAAIRKRVPPESTAILSCLFEQPRRRRKRASKPKTPAGRRR